MATSRRDNSEIEAARVEAIVELDRSESALIQALNDAPNPVAVGQKGGEWAYNAAQRGEYIKTVKANVASFKAQANGLASAGNLQELKGMAEGKSQRQCRKIDTRILQAPVSTL